MEFNNSPIEPAKKKEFKRILSPSAVNLYFQCPRRFYYRYIMKLPVKDSIHTVRGTIVHNVLENFFDFDFKLLTNVNYKDLLYKHISELFKNEWTKYKKKLDNLNMDPKDIQFYKEDSVIQIDNWMNKFLSNLENKLKELFVIEKAWKYWMPKYREIELRSEMLGMRGFVDQVLQLGSRTLLIDYKTSKSAKLSPDYMLQLATYHILYKEKFGIEAEAYLWFLKFGLKKVPISPDLIADTKFKIEQVHMALESDTILDYQKNVTPLCKWENANGKGQCDFYEECFSQKSLTDEF